MILQALHDYYHRTKLAPPGWEFKAIPFLITLNTDGVVINVISTVDKENRRGRPILVPQSEIRSGKNAWAQPNLLWDHYGFVLGEPKRKPDGSIDPADSYEKSERQRIAFVARINALLVKYPNSPGLIAISKFFDNGEYRNVFTRPDAVEMTKIPGANLTFQLVGAIEPIVHEPWVKDVATIDGAANEAEEFSVVEKSAICLVTGEFTEIVRLHPKIYRASSKPTALAAANSKEAQAYSSYGKDQGFIFPVGKAAAFAYTTALNHLLRKDSPQRVQVGDASTVFWADVESPYESAFAQLFGSDTKDDPDAGASAAQALLQAIHSGRFAQPEGDNRFHMLGL